MWLDTQWQSTLPPSIDELDDATRLWLESFERLREQHGAERFSSTSRHTFEIFRVEASSHVQDNGHSYLTFTCSPFDECIIQSLRDDEIERTRVGSVPCVDAEAAAAYFEEHVVRWQSPYS